MGNQQKSGDIWGTSGPRSEHTGAGVRLPKREPERRHSPVMKRRVPSQDQAPALRERERPRRGLCREGCLVRGTGWGVFIISLVRLLPAQAEGRGAVQLSLLQGGGAFCSPSRPSRGRRAAEKRPSASLGPSSRPPRTPHSPPRHLRLKRGWWRRTGSEGPLWTERQATRRFKGPDSLGPGREALTRVSWRPRAARGKSVPRLPLALYKHKEK